MCRTGNSPNGRNLQPRFTVLLAIHRAAEPRAGVGPVPFRRTRRDAEGLCGLFDGQSGEVAPFDEAGLFRFRVGEFFERVVEREQAVVIIRLDDRVVV